MQRGAGDAEGGDTGSRHRACRRRSLPSDAELQAAGARIGEIRIENRQIFDLDNPQENNWLFRTADALHVRTRESAIRAQLLFRSGDRYSRRVLDETARNLRQNASFMREPEIHPLRYHDGVVDLLVITHDVWTLQPGINFGRSGGTNTSSIDVSDDNFLGLGKYVELGHGQNVDRSSTFAQWSDPNVWGSRWRDSLRYQNNSDGQAWHIGGNYPFYSLETRYDGGGSTGSSRSVITRYNLGNPYDAYEFNWRVSDFYFGQALLINELWTERLLIGFRNDHSDFSPALNQTLLAPLPADRHLGYPRTRCNGCRTTTPPHAISNCLHLPKTCISGLTPAPAWAGPRPCSAPIARRCCWTPRLATTGASGRVTFCSSTAACIRASNTGTWTTRWFPATPATS